MFANANFNDNMTGDEMKIEPRLMEYLKKKKYYKANKIRDDLLEKEYNIDKNDIKNIQQYLMGRKIQKKSLHTDYVDNSANQFPSEKLLKDPRLDKIKKKQQRDRDAGTQRHNYDFISKGYDMYRDDRQFASAMGNDFKSNFNPSVWFEQSRNTQELEYDDANPNVAQVVDMRRRFANTNVYKNTKPAIRYKNYMPRGNNTDLNDESYSLDSIINKLDNYHENVSWDLRKQNKASIRDVEMENYLAFGDQPSIGKGKKSIGYPNPVENHFSYISDDIQNPDHVVFERGMPSRLFNKDVARKTTKRDVM
jgi:hypothetical protein